MVFTGLAEQRERLRSEIDANIAVVLDHGRFIMGPEVGQFEQELAQFSDVKHAIGVANGTDAIQIAMMAAGIGYGDAVFVPSFTYTATAEVILILGAIPVFVEVDASTFNIDSDDLVKKIAKATADGMRPKAIISVDLFGLPHDSDTINRIAKEHALFHISDAAQSFGARDAKGRPVGTLAPITTTSFFPAKPLGCFGDGGGIFTNDDDLAATMRSIRTHGQGKAKYETVRVGMNSRLDTIQAAILLAKIKIFAEEIANRNSLADAYHDCLKDLVTTPIKAEGVVSAWAQYTIRVDNRDAVKERLDGIGVPTAVYYPKPMHLQPAYAAFGDGLGSLPVSEMLSEQVISLPMNPYWIQADVDAVFDGLTKALATPSMATN
ncbi:DegT/DnrJ/EryC1/StrS family aminotransferase [Parasphingorhabdus halotolerans]|uniref:DegT/DnrJ/EryC1/StrS family aminotransferase n=1 Tax=Parasphingorhabdus halotolerans TaxID=2725558 RepID=A0A6H2DS55_9SPHN|nr:DegT/DnrJ/EryC1/StrS family aminotransferase [Parasphingorhabdus halotolerans]